MNSPSGPNSRAPDAPARITYRNGEWLAAGQPMLALNDPAVMQSVTVVERIRTYGTKLFQLERHLDRWSASVDALQIVGLPTNDQLRSILDELIARNQPWVDQEEDFGVLLIASPGFGGTPTLIADLWEIDQTRVTNRIRNGSPVVVTDVEQPSPSSWSRHIKTRCRLHYYLADRQAQAHSNETLGVLVDSEGSITETGIANVLIVEGRSVVQPESEQILHGVSMQIARELAMKIGIAWSEDRISAERLENADEILLTGTSCGIWFGYPASHGGQNRPGPIYTQLRTAFDGLIASKKW